MRRDRYGEPIEPDELDEPPMTIEQEHAAIAALPHDERAVLLAHARASCPWLGDRDDDHPAVRGALINAWREGRDGTGALHDDDGGLDATEAATLRRRARARRGVAEAAWSNGAPL